MTHTDNPDPIQVPIQRLPHAVGLPLPSYATDHAAGLDLRAAVSEHKPLLLKPNTVALIPTGFAIAVPSGYEAQVRPRSGLAYKFAVSIPNAPGTIDADYRGELKVLLINHATDAFEITRGMRVAQLLIKPVPRTQWIELDDLPPTTRGAGGFGSTGTE